MNKELEEAWNIIRHYNDEIVHTSDSEYVKNPLEEEIDIVNKALLELKAIKESNPNEALELVYCLKDCLMNMMPYYDWLNDIEKYILNAQEQEKKLNALEIIKNKKVNIYHIWIFDNYQQYKEHYPFGEYHAKEDMLTFEEFNLLKEVFG